MVPFPYVFKARVLSKSWLARLSPISSQDDEEKKHLAISFQKQIGQWSDNWKTFCPVQLDHNLSLDDFYGYDRSSHSLKRLPSISFLGKIFDKDDSYIFSCCKLFTEGALILCQNRQRLYVANILTREWKELPPCPYEGLEWCDIIFSHTLETYKVILILPDPTSDHWLIVIYDSASSVWTTIKMISDILDQYEAITTYLDGVLFFFVDDYSTCRFKVMCLDIKHGSLLQEVVNVADVELRSLGKIVFSSPVICNTNLLIVFLRMYEGPSNLVVKIDLGRKQLLGVSMGPIHYPPGLHSIIHPVCDGHYVFTDIEVDGSGVFAYNIHADQWELLPCMAPVREGSRKWNRSMWGDFNSCRSFRPGLNPFAAC